MSSSRSHEDKEGEVFLYFSLSSLVRCLGNRCYYKPSKGFSYTLDYLYQNAWRLVKNADSRVCIKPPALTLGAGA